jgi:hypothetical protein
MRTTQSTRPALTFCLISGAWEARPTSSSAAINGHFSFPGGFAKCNSDIASAGRPGTSANAPAQRFPPVRFEVTASAAMRTASWGKVVLDGVIGSLSAINSPIASSGSARSHFAPRSAVAAPIIERKPRRTRTQVGAGVSTFCCRHSWGSCLWAERQLFQSPPVCSQASVRGQGVER